MSERVDIPGSCHCGNLRFTLRWPGPGAEIPVRECSCTFCRKHGGAWTSHPAAKLAIAVEDDSAVSRYRFGTGTADFHVCSVCGIVPFVISEIAGNQYAVVNVNTFDGPAGLRLTRSASNFDGEGAGDRLDRRRRNWIAQVEIARA